MFFVIILWGNRGTKSAYLLMLMLYGIVKTDVAYSICICTLISWWWHAKDLIASIANS